MVPSPPSAIGITTVSARGRALQIPSAQALPASFELIHPLKESIAITTFIQTAPSTSIVVFPETPDPGIPPDSGGLSSTCKYTPFRLGWTIKSAFASLHGRRKRRKDGAGKIFKNFQIGSCKNRIPIL